MKRKGDLVDRKQINLSSNLVDVIVQMSEGIPGAVTVLAQLAKDPSGLLDILHLDDMDMRGSQIWVGFKDHCKSDLEAFRKAVRARDPKMIATVNAAGGLEPGTPKAVLHGASRSHISD